jgi:PAS domain S-box-containing protein
MKRPVLEQIGDAKRLALLVEAVTDYALYLLDLDGNVISWNSGARRIKGYTPDEIIGKNFSTFFTRRRKARARLADRSKRRTLRGRRLAHAQGRVPFLGLGGTRCGAG